MPASVEIDAVGLPGHCCRHHVADDVETGIQVQDLVLLVMNQRGVDRLLESKVSLGADVWIAAGPVGRSGTAATDAQMNTQMLAYSRSRGLFAGIDLSGGALRPDVEANGRAYGPSTRAIDIVHGTQKVTDPPAARSFVAALDRNVRATTGQGR